MSELASPDIWEELTRRAPDLTAAIKKLETDGFSTSVKHTNSKNFNDPIWHIIELQPWEVSALDLPLMQRLRRVRQLGMAHVVYPSAQHSRFEHSLGAVAAATQMFDALLRRTNIRSDDNIERLRKCVRLAALMHDCGHGAFSHVSERSLGKSVLGSQLSEAKAALDVLFSPKSPSIGVQEKAAPDLVDMAGPPAAELIAALLLLTPSMGDFLSRQACGLDESDQLRMAGLVLGRAHGLQTATAAGSVALDYVRSIISGDLDADKLDYVARDAYFAGIPIAADVHRLISQLEAIPIDGRGANKWALGVQPTGVSAVEMFILTRAYLFDRIYQHPKIRAAEAIVARMLASHAVGREPAQLVDLIYHKGGDDYCIGATSDDMPASVSLADRRLPRRALAISPRYCVGTSVVRRASKRRFSSTTDCGR